MRTLLLVLMLFSSAASAQQGRSAEPDIPMLALEEAVRNPTGFDVSRLVIPDLTFRSNARIAADFDKYFYFHRSGNDFASAVADISECDAVAVGSATGMRSTDAGVAGAAATYGVGPALGGSIIVDLIGAASASAEMREQRRLGLRRCMALKGYVRYGLPESIWRQFNLQGSQLQTQPGRRLLMVLLQARIASLPDAPTPERLEP